VSDPRAGAWISGLVLGVVSGLTLITFGVPGAVFAALSLGLIAWKGPRRLAAAGFLMGVGMIWSVLFARVGLDCTVFLGPGEGCELGSIWGWVAVSVAFFAGGIVASALALQRTRR
jgi:hypothetical protein